MDENISTHGYTCGICKNVYKHSRSLNQHIAKHHNDYKCTICKGKYLNEMQYVEHMQEHLGHYKCLQCEYTTLTKPAMEVHFKDHKHLNLVCDLCSKVFINAKTLTKHMELHGVSTKKKYTCEECQKVFFDYIMYIEHDNFHKNIKPFVCNVCEKAFMYSRYLSVHKSAVHRKPPPGKLYCEICQKEYTNKSSLRAHLKTHTQKSSICDICGKQLSTRDKLRVHMRIHTGDKPYKCNYCEKTFSKYSTRQGHERIHTGVKPYKCEVCDRCFTQRTSMVIHRRLHTGEKPYICHICDKGFISKNLLNMHLRKSKDHEDLYQFIKNDDGNKSLI